MIADPKHADPSSRSSREIPLGRPRWAFWKGLLTGVAIEIPLLAVTVWILCQLGLANPSAGFMRIMRLTTVFAGIAALFTAGGVGRLAAYASVEGGRRRAVIVAARAHAAAGIGLVIIATVPHGELPSDPWGWVAIGAAGLVPGAVCGAIIGFVCSGQSAVIADVWSLATKPSEALRQLLDPKDLVKLGAALRTRTSTLFEGIFEPAPPPPPGEPDTRSQSEPKPSAPSTPAASSTTPTPERKDA